MLMGLSCKHFTDRVTVLLLLVLLFCYRPVLTACLIYEMGCLVSDFFDEAEYSVKLNQR